MNNENELEEIDSDQISIEKPKKKRVSKKVVPLTIAETPDSKPLKQALVASDFAKQMDEYNKYLLAPVKPKRVMSDAQKNALKMGRERKQLLKQGLLSPPPPPSKIEEVVVKPLPPVIVKPKTKSYRTMY